MLHVTHQLINIGHVDTPCQTGAYITINGHQRWFKPDYWVNPPTNEFVDMIATYLCEQCPLLKQCAHNALHAGDTIDHGYTNSATGVIQAGIYCTGDTRTDKELAATAGVPTPNREPHPRYTPPTHCRGCNRPMVTRPKGQRLTPDMVTHTAHGYCRVCDARRRKTHRAHQHTRKAFA